MYPHILISSSNHRIKIKCDGINIKAEQLVGSEIEERDLSIFYTIIPLRNTNKIIPYLLIDKCESETEYKITNLRDPKISSKPLCNTLDNNNYKITEIKLRFSGFNKYGGMIWKGIM